VEGLPGSGKSTTSHLLCLHLERHGHRARWYWEHETPHPVFENAVLQDALDGGRLPEDFADAALGRWRRLAEELAGSDRTLILESAFFQTPVHPMLLLGWSAEQIRGYVEEVERALAPVSILLVVLGQPDVAGALRATTTSRGQWFLDYLEGRVCRSAYGRAHGLEGEAGVVRYLEAYRDLIDRLLSGLRLPRLVLADEPRPVLGDRIAAALGLPPVGPFETPVADLAAYAGRYCAPGSDDTYEVVTDGQHLYVDGAGRTRLIHRGGSVFELAGTCVHLAFQPNPSGAVRSLECRGNLPNLARDWVKSTA
jgi:hypothetical protein